MMSTKPTLATAKHNKKRKRQGTTKPDEQLELERKERYDKLLYQAKKALHKEAKVVKSFEVQKVVRRIKNGKDCDKHRVELLNEKLAELKHLSVDTVVNICIKRLGIPNLNPNLDQEKTEKSASCDAVIEKFLQHNRLSAAMEMWNEKVADYRRWYLRRQDVVSRVPEFVQEMRPVTLPKHLAKKKQDEVPSMFVSLGGLQDNDESNDEEGNHDKYLAYGPASSMSMEMTKNRPGQRQRQAKAKAVQARKEGRTLDKSLNWREKKKDNGQELDDVPMKSKATVFKDVKPQRVEAATIAELGKTWQDEGKAHPSWAASASQKTGIVEFTGTKITFD
jgi:hypothetical protein